MSVNRLKNLTERTEGDLLRFDERCTQVRGKIYPDTQEGFLESMRDIRAILLDGSILLVQLSDIKYQVSRVVESSGNFELQQSKRFYTNEISDLISTVRAAVYGFQETAKLTRDIYEAQLSREKNRASVEK
jgi:hypothetical protein